MASKLAFTEEELQVDESLGYPKAYVKLSRSPNVLKPYSQGPPSIFVPYSLQPQEALRAKDLNQIFPVIDPEASPSMNPRGYVNLLWKQLDHLGNAGFDPALFRVDPYGNVLYLHADSASPLAWDIDHWFPCSRGGKTIPSNLRLLQWQVRKKKKNKLEFLVPWWDLQVGISVNQFLSSFASSNSDFRNRAFCFLFSDGGNEELNALQSADFHSFPQHYDEMKRHLGLAPAGIVSSQRSSDASVLRPLDINKNLRPNSPLSASRKFSAEEYDAPSTAIQRFRPGISKENDNPSVDCYHTNPYFSILTARESLRQREESMKKQEEISLLEGELDELMQNNEDERIALQELEALVIKKRRRVEKCRRLAEAQASYRALLEKMIRDAMHRAVVYKEQIRVNQAATSALMARLEAQREICDSSGREHQKKFKQRDEIEKQIRPCGEHARKRMRIDDTLEERHDKLLWLSRTCSPIKKELRIFLEEHKVSEVGSSLVHEDEQGTKVEESLNTTDGERVEISKPVIVSKNESSNVVCTSATSASGMSQYRNANKLKKTSFIQSPLVESEEARTMLASKEVESHEQKLKKLAMSEELCSETSEPGKELLHRRPYPSEQRAMLVASDETSLSNKLEKLEIRENQFAKIDRPQKKNLLPPNPHNEGEDDDNEEHRNQVGKENIEKWMKMMLDNAQEGSSEDSSSGKPAKVENNADEIVSRLNPINAQKEIKYFRLKSREQNVGFHQTNDDEEINARGCDEKRGKRTIEISAIKMLNKNIQKSGVGSSSASKGFGSRKSFEGKEREERRRGGTARCESARGFRSFPSSPTVILSMSKGVDCMGRKPKVIGDEIDDKEECNGDSVATSSNKFLKAWTTRSSK